MNPRPIQGRAVTERTWYPSPAESRRGSHTQGTGSPCCSKICPNFRHTSPLDCSWGHVLPQLQGPVHSRCTEREERTQEEAQPPPQAKRRGTDLWKVTECFGKTWSKTSGLR